MNFYIVFSQCLYCNDKTMKIVIPYFALLLLCVIIIPNYKIINDEKTSICKSGIRKDVYIFYFILIILCVFTGFRQIIASSIDEYAYRNRWDQYSQISYFSLFNENSHEFIFSFFYWLSTRLFPTNQGGILLTAIFITSSTLYVLRRDCGDFKYGLLLTFATGWFWDTFNGIQQCTAAVLFFICLHFVINHQLISYFISVIVCVCVHQASLVLFPIYFIADNKIDRKIQLMIFICTLLLLLLLYQYTFFLSHYIVTLEQYSDIVFKERHGVNIITRIISVIPAIIAFYFFPKIHISDIMTRFSANMTFIHAAIMLAAFRDTYIARFALFTSFFIIIFFSRIGQYFIDSKKYILFKYATIILYSIVTYIRMYNSLYVFNFRL